MTAKASDKALKTKDDEPIELTPDRLEELLLGCYREVLKSIQKVANKEMTPDEATQYDQVLARHLARTLMGENGGFAMKLPYQGVALLEKIQSEWPALFDDKAMKDQGIDPTNPRALMVFVTTRFMAEIYHNISITTKTDDDKVAEAIRINSQAIAALWRRRFCERVVA